MPDSLIIEYGPLAPMLGIIAALLLLCLLIVLGSLLLRLLAIPVEPPDEARFQPPSPGPIPGPPDAAAAQARAAARRALAPRYEQARTVMSQWLQIKEAALLLRQHLPGKAAEVQEWEGRADAVEHRLQTLLPQLANEASALPALAEDMQTVYSRFEAWYQELPAQRGRRWLWLGLALLLVVSLLLLVLMSGGAPR